MVRNSTVTGMIFVKKVIQIEEGITGVQIWYVVLFPTAAIMVWLEHDASLRTNHAFFPPLVTAPIRAFAIFHGKLRTRSPGLNYRPTDCSGWFGFLMIDLALLYHEESISVQHF